MFLNPRPPHFLLHKRAKHHYKAYPHNSNPNMALPGVLSAKDLDTKPPIVSIEEVLLWLNGRQLEGRKRGRNSRRRP